MSRLHAIRGPERAIPVSDREPIHGLDRAELRAFVGARLGGPAYQSDQIFAWLHARRVRDFEAMSDLSKAARTALAERAEAPTLTVIEAAPGGDGTRKLALRTVDGLVLETVLIPNPRGYTQCISSMLGCSLTCAFCATASLGFLRNLATWEIVEQVYRAQDLLAREGDERRIGNLVFMGMGEPLHNYNQVRRAIAILTDEKGMALAGRRITVSTAGLVPAIERFGREGLGHQVGLAVSLNATTDEVRDRIMPINTKWNIATLLGVVGRLPQPKRRRVTFEYVLLADVNDGDADVDRLQRLLRSIPCKVNLIPFNPHPHAPFSRPTPERIERFASRARRSGLQIHLRRPRGDDIAAACGQLAAEKR